MVDYQPKGTYSDLKGHKTYISGDGDNKNAVLMVYDVFGFSPQILQGESQGWIKVVTCIDLDQERISSLLRDSKCTCPTS